MMEKMPMEKMPIKEENFRENEVLKQEEKSRQAASLRIRELISQRKSGKEVGNAIIGEYEKGNFSKEDIERLAKELKFKDLKGRLKKYLKKINQETEKTPPSSLNQKNIDLSGAISGTPEDALEEGLKKRSLGKEVPGGVSNSEKLEEYIRKKFTGEAKPEGAPQEKISEGEVSEKPKEDIELIRDKIRKARSDEEILDILDAAWEEGKEKYIVALDEYAEYIKKSREKREAKPEGAPQEKISEGEVSEKPKEDLNVSAKNQEAAKSAVETAVPELTPEQKEEKTFEEIFEESRKDLDVFAEDLEAVKSAVETAAPELTPEQQNEIAKEMQTEEGKKSLKDKIINHLKKLWQKEKWTGALGLAAGISARMAIRSGFGGGMLVGVGAGAVAGAIRRALPEYIRERQERKIVAQSIIEKIRLADDLTQKSAILAKAKEEYDKARVRGSEEEMRNLKYELLTAKTLIEAESQKLENASEREKISTILAIINKNNNEISETRRPEVEKLIKKVKFELTPVDKKKIVKAALRGALAGAIGGAIGGAMSHYLLDHIEGKVPVAETIKEVGKQTKESVAPEGLVRKAIEGIRRPMAEIAEKAKEKIINSKFTAITEKGEGLTHAARKMIHDYLVNQEKLGGGPAEKLSVEQLVYAEDTLQKELALSAKGVIQIGDKFEVSGEEISKIIEKAAALSPEKINNIKELLQDPAHHLSNETLEFMQNTESLSAPENDFYSKVVEEAERQAQEAAQKSVEEGLALAESLRESQEEFLKEGTERFAAPEEEEIITSTQKVIMALIGGVGTVSLGARFYLKKKKAAREQLGEGEIEETKNKESESKISEKEDKIYEERRKSIEDFFKYLKDEKGIEIETQKISEDYKKIGYLERLKQAIEKIGMDKFKDKVKMIEISEVGENKMEGNKLTINISKEDSEIERFLGENFKGADL